MYCKKCGGKLESYASNCAFCGEPVEKYDDKVKQVKENVHEEKSQMTTAKWIGFFFLNAIPVIGTIVYLVLIFKWAFGSNSDKTLKSYARATLILMLISILLVVLLIALALNLGINTDDLLQKLESKQM